MERLRGKVAFITGAARGQGRAHAVRLAEEGADIVAVDLCGPIPGMSYPPATDEDLAQTVSLVERTGRRVIARKADVRSYDELTTAIAHGVSRLGRLDIVCANAGIGSPPYPAHEIPGDLWQEMLDINLTGVWVTCKAAIPQLLEQNQGGSIVLISSTAGLKAYKNIAHYVTAKHGVVGLMRTLASELAPYNIRVNSLHPTNVNTSMIMNEAIYKLFCPDIEQPDRNDFARASQALNTLPVPWVEPEDVSNALLFLASDEARYITGVALPIDAGFLLR